MADAVGVSTQTAQLARMGRRVDAETAGRHARFAASLAVNDLMSERSVTEVVAKWGQPNFVSVGGEWFTAWLAIAESKQLRLNVPMGWGVCSGRLTALCRHPIR